MLNQDCHVGLDLDSSTAAVQYSTRVRIDSNFQISSLISVLRRFLKFKDQIGDKGARPKKKDQRDIASQ